MAAAEAGAALAADRIDLIDEDDARRVLLGRFEQVTDTGCPDTDEHLDEVRTGDREERDARFAGHRTAEERLTGTRRPHEENPLRNAGTDVVKLVRVFQEINDFNEFRLFFVGARDIVECNFLLLFIIELRFALAEVHDLVPAALGLVQEEEEEDDDDDEWNEPRQELDPAARLRSRQEGDLRVSLVRDPVDFIHELFVVRRDVNDEGFAFLGVLHDPFYFIDQLVGLDGRFLYIPAGKR